MDTTQTFFLDKQSGALIAYFRDPGHEPVPPAMANRREISWPDGATAIQLWPVEDLNEDEAPHPYGAVPTPEQMVSIEASLRSLVKDLEAFNFSQRRVPAGSPEGGQWTDEGLPHDASQRARTAYAKVKDSLNEEQKSFLKSLFTKPVLDVRDFYSQMTGDELSTRYTAREVRDAAVEEWLRRVGASIDSGETYK